MDEKLKVGQDMSPTFRAEQEERARENERRHQRGARGALSQWFYPLAELTKTRLREFIREPEAVFWVFVFPVLLACALGIAFRSAAPEKIGIGVETGSDRAASDALMKTFAASPDLRPVELSPSDAQQALRSGRVALVVQPNATEGVASQQSFTYRYNPTRPESRLARQTVDDVLQRSLGRADVSTARDEKVIEPGARYIDFLIPGLIGLNLMGSGLWGLGFAVVSARSRKLLKRLAATPMRRSHYLLSFILSRLIFLALEVIAILGFARLVFGVGVRGSLFSLGVVALAGSFAFAGIGLLLAARPTTIEGVSGWMNFVMLPMWLLSGTFFTSERFPQVIQPFIKILPLTALNESMRAIMNDGAPLAASWSQILILIIWAALGFTLALRLFRWQ